jgi:hypothetical protein
LFLILHELPFASCFCLLHASYRDGGFVCSHGVPEILMISAAHRPQRAHGMDASCRHEATSFCTVEF